MLKIGMAGTGNAARQLMRALGMLSHELPIEISHVLTSNPAWGAEQYSKNMPSLEVTDSLDHLIASTDAVIICSATNNLAERMMACAKAKRAFIVEKPVSRNTEELVEARNLIKEYDPFHLIAFNRRYDPSVQVMKNAITSGQLGTVNSFHSFNRDPDYNGLGKVPYTGGYLRDSISHDVDMAQFLSGRPVKKVFARAAKITGYEEYDDWDNVWFRLEFDDESAFSSHGCRNFPGGFEYRIEAIGTKAMAQFGNVSNPNTIIQTQEAGSGMSQLPLEDRGKVCAFGQRFAKSHELMLYDFFSKLMGGQTIHPWWCDIDQALETSLLQDAIKESIAQSSEVDFESFKKEKLNSIK